MSAVQRRGARGGRREIRRRRPRPGTGRLHPCGGALCLTRRCCGRRPAPGQVPRAWHPPRPALETPAGAQRLGQPHPGRNQDRRPRGGGTVQPGDRRQAAALPADGRDPRLPHPEEARRAFAHGHRPRAALRTASGDGRSTASRGPEAGGTTSVLVAGWTFVSSFQAARGGRARLA